MCAIRHHPKTSVQGQLVTPSQVGECLCVQIQHGMVVRPTQREPTIVSRCEVCDFPTNNAPCIRCGLAICENCEADEHRCMCFLPNVTTAKHETTFNNYTWPHSSAQQEALGPPRGIDVDVISQSSGEITKYFCRQYKLDPAHSISSCSSYGILLAEFFLKSRRRME